MKSNNCPCDLTSCIKLCSSFCLIISDYMMRMHVTLLSSVCMTLIAFFLVIPFISNYTEVQIRGVNTNIQFNLAVNLLFLRSRSRTNRVFML